MCNGEETKGMAECLMDLMAYEKAMKAYREDPTTYTLEEVEKLLLEESTEGECT